MGSRYRRAVAAPAPEGASSSDPSDPYAAYLAWVASGRPSLTGGSAAERPEAGTLLLTEHVQVQQLAEAEAPPALPATKPSPWQRLTGALRRRG